MATRSGRKGAGMKLQALLDLEKADSDAFGEFSSPVSTKTNKDGVQLHDVRRDSRALDSNQTGLECEKLCRDLEALQLERQRIELENQIADEKVKIRDLQLGHVAFARGNSGPRGLDNNGNARPATTPGNRDRFTLSLDTATELGEKTTSLKIVDFVWEECGTEELEIEICKDAKLNIGKRKSKLTDITMEQWGYANTKIMVELLKSGQLRPTDWEAYLKYSADIFRLASRYSWKSVLTYDKEYRDRQATDHFQWGSYFQELQDFQLVPKALQNLASYSKSQQPRIDTVGPRRKGPFTPAGREICRNFNRDICVRRDCKLAHVCSTCFQGHSESRHGSMNNAVPKKTAASSIPARDATLATKPTTSRINLNPDAWHALLPDHHRDKDFIMMGVKEGFRILDEGSQIQTGVFVKNASSTRQYRDGVEIAIRKEMDLGNYQIVHSQPDIVSSLGAIPKDDGTVRLIHDGSRPADGSMNSYVTDTSVSYDDIRTACKIIQPNNYLAKVDLKHAYRSVCIHPDNYRATGLFWKFQGAQTGTFFVDTKLPFGSSRSPKIFQTLSSAVCDIMHHHFQITVIAYLDDFLVVAATKSECEYGLAMLLRVLRYLGFYINWSKVVGPSTRLVFLGVQLDTVNYTLSLPADKLRSFKTLLQDFALRKRASKHQLEVLAGKLNWASQVISGGRVFLRRILTLKDSMAHQHHKVVLSEGFYGDIQWWQDFLSIFNGTVKMQDSRPITSVHTDACMEGCGGVYNGDYFYINWKTDLPSVGNWHINYKETFTIYAAAVKWGHHWENRRVIVYTDNITARSLINKGSTQNIDMMRYLRKLFWISSIHNFSLYAVYLPGKVNILADTCSRLDELDKLSKLYALMPV